VKTSAKATDYVLTLATWAARHREVHFYLSHLAKGSKEGNIAFAILLMFLRTNFANVNEA
jgi:hypothetical protein